MARFIPVLKIDEVNNLGAARIRVRSLLAALRAKDAQNKKREIRSASIEKVVFTKQMRKDYTILCPQMSPIPFQYPAGCIQQQWLSSGSPSE